MFNGGKARTNNLNYRYYYTFMAHIYHFRIMSVFTLIVISSAWGVKKRKTNIYINKYQHINIRLILMFLIILLFGHNFRNNYWKRMKFSSQSLSCKVVYTNRCKYDTNLKYFGAKHIIQHSRKSFENPIQYVGKSDLLCLVHDGAAVLGVR